MTAEFRYTVFGLTIVSNRPIPRLRPLDGSAGKPDVTMTLGPASFARFEKQDWRVFREGSALTEDGRPLVRVLCTTSHDHFWFAYADGTDLVVTRAGDRVWTRWRPPNEIEDVATYLLGPMLGFVLRLQGRLTLHASAVVIDGFAVACAGTGGSGKSTTAAVFAQRGMPVVTDDIVVLRGATAGEVVVEPDSPIVRLWPRSSEFLYGSPDALPRLSQTWEKCYLDLETRGYPVAREPQRLGAVYVFDGEVAPGDDPELTPLRGSEAFLALLANLYSTLDHDADLRAAEFEVLSGLVRQIEVRRFRQPERPISPTAVCDLIQADWSRAAPRIAAEAELDLDEGRTVVA